MMHCSSLLNIILSLLYLYNIVSAVPIPQLPDKLIGVVPDDGSIQSQPQAGTGIAAIPYNFPDPSFIGTSDGFYAFATSGNGHYIQIARTPSFSNPSWEMLDTEPLPDPGSWTDGTKNIWAPYVHQTPSGSFVMYYSAIPSVDTTKHCIGTATSDIITGPYTPSPNPFACDLTAGGAIDPSTFTDPTTNNLYILYKIDGNSMGPGTPTPIMLQRVSPSDGLTKIDSPFEILRQSADGSDGPLVEAPTLLHANDTYFLLFSSNYYTTPAYDIKYVSSRSLTSAGFTAQPTTVLLHTDDGNHVIAPGSCDWHDGMFVFHGTTAFDPLDCHMYAGFVEAMGNQLLFMGSA